MLHGQRLVLLVYLHLTLVVQYNIILIIINSIYTILLFANKQWGSGSIVQNSNESIVYIPITITSKLVIVTLDKVNRNNPVVIGFYADDEIDDKKTLKFILENNSIEANNTFFWFGLFK